jgi:hypothetical protein
LKIKSEVMCHRHPSFSSPFYGRKWMKYNTPKPALP